MREARSSVRNNFPTYIISPGESKTVDGINFIGVQNYSSRIQMYTVAKEIVRKSNDIDAEIIQFHDPIFLLFTNSLKKRGKKIIFDSHEFYGLQIKEKEYLPKVVRNFISKIYKRIEKFYCCRIDAVIQVCTINGSDYFLNRASKSIIIPNMVDLHKMNLIDVPNRKRQTAIYVGALAYNRGISHLVKASAYSKVSLQLVGKLNEDYKRELQRLPEFTNVDFTGFINANDIPSVLANGLVGISTLLNIGQYNQIDTLPTKVYEYMLAEMPVILSNTPYNKKMVDKYRFGLCVDPSNPKEIGEAINYLYENPKISEEMGKNGRVAVQKELNWSTQEEKLIEFYSSL